MLFRSNTVVLRLRNRLFRVVGTWGFFLVTSPKLYHHSHYRHHSGPSDYLPNIFRHTPGHFVTVTHGVGLCGQATLTRKVLGCHPVSRDILWSSHLRYSFCFHLLFSIYTIGLVFVFSSLNINIVFLLHPSSPSEEFLPLRYLYSGGSTLEI